jgi:hypothetical protein
MKSLNNAWEQTQGLGRHVQMSRRLPLLVLPLVFMTACALNNRPTLSPTKMAEFWQEPTDAAQRDLLNGPGGAALAPNPKGTFNLVKADPTGFSPGLDVKDDRGQEWSIKLGPEARTEVVASRIVWAMGYHQPSVYYLPHFSLRENGTVKTEGPGRFRLKPSTQKTLGEWSWRKNPFLDTQPFAGLFVLMTVLNNWDIKTQQNGVYSTPVTGGSAQHQYVVKDLGASFGKTNWWLPVTQAIPIVLVTALDPEDVETVTADGAITILRKPCHAGEVLDSLNAVLDLPDSVG